MSTQNEIIGKEQLLSRLYTLRAGLSVVSQEKDEFDSIKASAENKKNSVQSKADSDLKNCKQRAKNAKFKKTAAENKIKLQTENENLKYHIKKKFTLYRALAVISTVLLASFLAAYAVYIILLNKGILHEAENMTKITTTMIALFAVGVPLIMTLSIKKSKKLKNEVEAIESENSAISDIQDATEEYNTALAELDKIKNSYDESIETADWEFSLALSKAEAHISAGSAVIAALNKTYSDLVDYRDWGNIDYIIYCLETRRADSMKEALQLTDAEKRANRIVEAVEMANMEICRTMTESIASLQNDMRKCFNILSNQITQQTSAIINNINGVKRSFANQAACLGELASEIKLNNALSAKANMTSERLADDVEYIRRYELN